MAQRSSSLSSFEAVPSRLRNLVHAHRPEVSIHIHRPQRTYTTLDKIQGSVSITAPVDTPFDDIYIEFVGTSRTYVERLTTAAAISGPAEAFHQFLKLTQPGLEQHYPENAILKAGVTYDLPFVFVVPQQLLIRICQHKVANPAVRDLHLQLPPTLGDKEIDSLDDLAPEMASIRYAISAKVSKLRVAEDGSTSTLCLVNKARNLRIVPAFDEQPPLDVNGSDSEYTMRKEKSVRKGVLKGKAGTLVAETAQPQSFRVRGRTDNDEETTTSTTTTTMATVMLRFDPLDDDAQPPKLGSLSSKLKVQTFFASSARHAFPSSSATPADLSQGLHAESLSLSQRCVANVEWSKHDPRKPATLPRRDSACSITTAGATPSPSQNYKGKVFYTARILAPIALPPHKTFVPTFHSCLVSRLYSLKLYLTLPAAGIGGSVDLKVPVQVSCDAHNQGDISPGRSGSISSDMLQDSSIDGGVEDVLRPRTIRVPHDHHVGRSSIGMNLRNLPVDAPPDYSALTIPGTMFVPVY